MHLVINTDGASRGNPGLAGIGVAIYENENLLQTHKEFLGTATNNVAEYTAVIRALELAKKRGAKKVKIVSDSELLVRQMTGVYKVKQEHLRVLFKKIKGLEESFDGVSYEHTYREGNTVADRLANEAIDNRDG